MHRPALNREPRVLILGEVLRDCFPDGREVTGGAPLNVAWNLVGLGRDPLFVSAIGSDAAGDQIRLQMQDWGLDVSGLSVIDDHPTGEVRVTFQDGEPEYEIRSPAAWDFIASPGAATPVQDAATSPPDGSIVYHGSLIFRGDVSRQRVTEWIGQTDAAPGVLRFVDLNIRDPWFDAAWTADLLGGADFIKLNQSELERITGLSCGDRGEIESAVDRMTARYVPAPSAVTLVTCGSQGAYWVGPHRHHVDAPGVPPATKPRQAGAPERSWFAPAAAVDELVDTVGAGDAFAAASIDGLLGGMEPQALLERAVRFAAAVCRRRGATTTDTSFYAAHRMA